MPVEDYGKIDGPATKLAADGRTVLTRFQVAGVIYARDLRSARAQINQANIYMDHAMIDRQCGDCHHPESLHTQASVYPCTFPCECAGFVAPE